MNDPHPSVPARKGRGCLFYGCLVSLLLLFLIGLLAFFTVRWFRNQFIALTDGAPMELPRVEMAEAEFNALDGRVKSFGAALEGANRPSRWS